MDRHARPRPDPTRRARAKLAAGLVLGAALALAPVSAPAQEASEGLEGLKREFDGMWDRMMDELGPRLDSLAETMETLERIDRLDYYERPEILPNGDIILRRRSDAPPLEPPSPDIDRFEGEPFDPDDPGIKT